MFNETLDVTLQNGAAPVKLHEGGDSFKVVLMDPANGAEFRWHTTVGGHDAYKPVQGVVYNPPKVCPIVKPGCTLYGQTWGPPSINCHLILEFEK